MGFPCSGFFPPVDNLPTLNTVKAGSSSLSYDPTTQTYTYVWKTDKSWRGTCHKFLMQLIDGTKHTALFKLTR